MNGSISGNEMNLGMRRYLYDVSLHGDDYLDLVDQSTRSALLGFGHLEALTGWMWAPTHLKEKSKPFSLFLPPLAEDPYPFWDIRCSAEKRNRTVHILKNISIVGALTILQQLAKYESQVQLSVRFKDVMVGDLCWPVSQEVVDGFGGKGGFAFVFVWSFRWIQPTSKRPGSFKATRIWVGVLPSWKV